MALTIIATVAIPQAQADKKPCVITTWDNDRQEWNQDCGDNLVHMLEHMNDRIVALEQKVFDLENVVVPGLNAQIIANAQPMERQTIEVIEDTSNSAFLGDKQTDKEMPEKAKCWFFC